MIHSTAIIHKNAEIGKNVKIGPYCIVDGGAVIGEGTVLKSYVHVHGDVILGKNNTFFQSSSIGEDCQDKKYAGEQTKLIVGDNNIIREFATLNRGTTATGETNIGSNNLLMAYCHIAHDCIIGDNIIMANSTHLGGHVEINDNAIIGGVTAIHQFCRIGSFAMVGAGSKVIKDVLPFSYADGSPLRVAGVNLVGLDRNGFSQERIAAIKKAFRTIYFRGLSLNDAVSSIE